MQVTYIDHMGTDLSVVNAARVSFDKESELEEGVLKGSDEKLIAYLAKHGHYSPFNHTNITVRVKAPIFVARQLQKHEYMPWNEVSRRYVDSEPEFYVLDWRSRPDASIKQGSGDFFDLPDSTEACVYSLISASVELYNQLLEDGVAPEQARAILPQNMMTEWYWSGTLKAWMKMINLRLDEHAQYETRLVAQGCFDIVSELFPTSSRELLWSV